MPRRAPMIVEEQRMTIIEHLEALRRALIVALSAWAIATVVAFFISGRVIGWLIDRAGIGHAIYLQPAGGVLLELKVALYIGVIIAAPVVIQQVWWLVSFVLLMVIGFGCVFELPVVLFVLGMLRIISSKWLHKNRVFWFLGLGILANFLTPGTDPVTPLIMFIPLYVFYEATALVLKLAGR